MHSNQVMVQISKYSGVMQNSAGIPTEFRRNSAGIYNLGDKLSVYKQDTVVYNKIMKINVSIIL
jgi:hypothetical protein